MGGAGKTPLAIALAKLLIAQGERPAFLTRGYGGCEAGPVWVDAARHNATDVGDEPLLLARHAPVIVARDRPDGARAIEQTDATVIVMDDGFQNPSLHKDSSIIAVDGGFGLGNKRVFPAGPLRAPLNFQIPRAHAIVTIGGMAKAPRSIKGNSHLAATLQPVDGGWLRGARVLAFCGIGRPEKFFETLRRCGAELVERNSFADHHVYDETEASRIIASARRLNAQLVTTEKDFVRLAPDGGDAIAELRREVRVLAVDLTFIKEDEDKLLNLLSSAVNRQQAY